MDVVDILDSDEEQVGEITSTNPTPTPIESSPIIAESSSQSPKTTPKNRPGPLSMKLKLGVSIEKDSSEPEPEPELNIAESPAADSGDPGDFRKQNKILSNLVDPSSKFLADFDPERSVRERRKMTRKTIGTQPTATAKPGTLYDENGVHRYSRLDACDCLDLYCPGCHFACPGCGSNKW